jgi:nucleoside-diphosphate-sugar epimerase
VSVGGRWLAEARSGKPNHVATRAARRDWTYVEDLAAALDAILARNPASGTLLHLGSGEVVTDFELAEAILRLVPEAPGLTQDQADAPVKAPMGSVRGDLLSGLAWTPFARGLATLAAGELAA